MKLQNETRRNEKIYNGMDKENIGGLTDTGKSKRNVLLGANKLARMGRLWEREGDS